MSRMGIAAEILKSSSVVVSSFRGRAAQFKHVLLLAWLRARRCSRRGHHHEKDERDAGSAVGSVMLEGGERLPYNYKKVSLLIACWKLVGRILHDKQRGRLITGLALAALCLLVLEVQATVYYSHVQQRYMTGLLGKNVDAFYSGLQEVGCLILFLSPIIASHECANWFLMMFSRESLTRRIALQYLAAPGTTTPPYYVLTMSGEVENPDQRICQDIEDFVSGLVFLMQDLIKTVLTVWGFASLLYSISPVACLGTVLYSTVGTLISTRCFGPRIGAYQTQRLSQEADLRAMLWRIRENAESVAFLNGGGAEWTSFEEAFSRLICTIRKSIWIGTGFSMFNRAFHWATFPVVPLLVGPLYLRGDLPGGVISQASLAFDIMLGSMTLLMDKFQALSDLAVRIRRLEALEDALRHAESQPSAGSITCTSHGISEDGFVLLQFSKVTLRTPLHSGKFQETLCQQLSFQICSGQWLLIVGESGIGKSSLLRAAAGLWTDGAGTIACHRHSSFFLPQKPYMFRGSLRSQLLYPQPPGNGEVSDADLECVLRKVNLTSVLDQHGISREKDWSSILSLGQQQRLSFARMLLRPDLRLVLIDEGTSACDVENEALLYKLLRDKICSVVSTGHRPSLRQYHSHALWLQSSRSGHGCCAARFLTMDELHCKGWGAAGGGNETSTC